jgi:prevent-host-death family protein
MARVITQRELRNMSGEIMRGLDRGEEYTITRNGVPVGLLTPIQRRRAVPAEQLVALFADAPPVDLDALRRDLDRAVDPDPRAG